MQAMRETCDRRLGVFLVALSCLWGAACSEEPPPPSPPNPSLPPIILISFDTCRADIFGVLTGEAPSLTPHLDAFAADAVIFEKAFAQIPHTLPSHMSLLTSTYPDSHGVKPEQGPLPESIISLPQIVQEAGYQTAGFVTTEWLKPDFGFGRGFDHYERIPHERTYSERVNKAALRHVQTLRQNPFFLFLHYYDLHSDFEQGGAANTLPYYSPPEYRRGLAIRADGSEFCDENGQCNTRYLMAMDRERRPLPQEKIDTIHALYRAAVPHLDAEMGAFFETLKEWDIYDSALIIITSDHGEEFREHGRFIHSQPYDETLHIPLFIKFPRSWNAGLRIPGVVETVDILPTVLSFLEIEAQQKGQGQDLMPLLRGEADHPKEAVFSQDTINLSRYGMRTGQRKFIMDVAASRRELYDLLTDPGEQENLASSEPEQVEAMETALRRAIRDNQNLQKILASPSSDAGDLLSPEERERLKSLGYLE